jgi:hypothetical protein
MYIKASCVNIEYNKKHRSSQSTNSTSGGEAQRYIQLEGKSIPAAHPQPLISIAPAKKDEYPHIDDDAQ